MKNDANMKAKELVAKMSVKEMIGQLLHNAPSIKRLSIPSYNWWNEGLHGSARGGTATVFPQAIGLASIFSEEMMYKIADIVSTEQRAKYNAFSSLNDRGIYKGLTIWSPNINIFRDPRWGRGQETYGEDPYLSKTLGVSFIKGLQGNNSDYLKTAACVKHFVAHSGPEPKRHYFNAIVNKKDLEETYLPSFKAAIQEAQVDAIMGAYSMINGEPACATDLIQNLLRDEYGFDGMFISDCWAIRDFHEKHKITKTKEESAALAVKKGCDLNCGCTFTALEKAYQMKLVSKEEIRKATERVFTTRFKLGMFEQTPYDSIQYSKVASKEHLKVSMEASLKSLVLLKNDDNFLPLSSTLSSIAVIGPNANSREVLWGNYHGTSQAYTTILEGIKKEVEDTCRIYYSEGSALNSVRVERLGEENDRISEAITCASLADVIILCLGLNETIEGEMHDDGNGGIAGDKKNLLLPPSQRILLEKVNSTNKPIVIVLLSGGSLDIEVDKYSNVKSIIQGWYPGEFGGAAISKTIFGENNPSGKLPITFYKNTNTLPDYDSYSMENRTYRYIKEEPLFPFGHGLSYTKFRYMNLTSNTTETSILLEVQIENIGKKDGDEITFVFAENKHLDSPLHPFLVSYSRNNIKAGESKPIIFDISLSSLSLVDEEGNRHTGNKKWTLYVGGSQPDSYSLSLTKGNILSVEIENKGDNINE